MLITTTYTPGSDGRQKYGPAFASRCVTQTPATLHFTCFRLIFYSAIVVTKRVCMDSQALHIFHSILLLFAFCFPSYLSGLKA